jgi:hypothetical protein
LGSSSAVVSAGSCLTIEGCSASLSWAPLPTGVMLSTVPTGTP